MLKDKLREARKNAKRTQKEVADAIGVKESTYCGYETGKREPDAIKIGAIAAFLGVSGDFLLETELAGHDNAPSKADEAILKVYRQLNDLGQGKLVSYGEGLLEDDKYKKYTSAQAGIA